MWSALQTLEAAEEKWQDNINIYITTSIKYNGDETEPDVKGWKYVLNTDFPPSDLKT